MQYAGTDGRMVAAGVVGTCTNCRLHETRRTIVYGRGEMPAHLLFIGEGPGASEDASGIAFYGKSGKLLDRMVDDASRLARIGARHVRTFITNVVLCHPTDEVGGANRQPHADEALACMPNVMRLHNIVQPRVTILVGQVAVKYYGKRFNPVASMVHPAALLRQGGTAAPAYLTNVRNLSLIIKGVMQ
jgi:DNA polymerase